MAFSPHFSSSTKILCLFLLSIVVIKGWIKNTNAVKRNWNLFAFVDPPLRSLEWAKARGMEPGYGGIWPGNPEAKKFNVTIRSKKTGEVFTASVPSDRYIYFYFEEQGIDLPVINKARMCRQGCCTICTAKVEEGKVKMEAPLGLLKDLREEGYVLTCCSLPRSDIVCELQDEDEVYIKQWSEGFEGGGVDWGGFLPEDD